jgi:nucleoside-diphosphate-sugar epimerase
MNIANNSKKKILIIGNQGYLGSRLSDFLLSKNYYCEGIDTGYFKNNKITNPLKIKTKKKSASQVKKNDIRGFDVVLMLAAFSNDPVGELSAKTFYKPTVSYTVNIAKICKSLGVRFIFPSSCSVYGYGKQTFTEKSGLKPLTHYSKNKVEIEKKLLKISSKNFRPIILRLATVFGLSPRMRFDIVINMFAGMAITNKKIILNSNGLAWRPHVHIDDVCMIFEKFINIDLNKNMKFIFNVGSNINNCRIVDLLKFLKKNIKDLSINFLHKSPLEKNDLFKDKKISHLGMDKRSYIVSFNKLNLLIPNLKFKYDLEIGISKLIRDLKKSKLKKNIFESYKFYRMQALKKVFKKK